MPLNKPLFTGAHALEDVILPDSESEQEQPRIPVSDVIDAADLTSNSFLVSDNQSQFQGAISQPVDKTDDESLPWVQL